MLLSEIHDQEKINRQKKVEDFAAKVAKYLRKNPDQSDIVSKMLGVEIRVRSNKPVAMGDLKLESSFKSGLSDVVKNSKTDYARDESPLEKSVPVKKKLKPKSPEALKYTISKHGKKTLIKQQFAPDEPERQPAKPKSAGLADRDKEFYGKFFNKKSGIDPEIDLGNPDEESVIPNNDKESVTPDVKKKGRFARFKDFTKQSFNDGRSEVLDKHAAKQAEKESARKAQQANPEISGGDAPVDDNYDSGNQATELNNTTSKISTIVGRLTPEEKKVVANSVAYLVR